MSARILKYGLAVALLGLGGAAGVAAQDELPILPDDWPPLSGLDAYLAEAELRSPEVLAARARVRAAAQVAPRVSALPDPTLRIGIENETLSDWRVGEDPMSGVSVSWEQELPGRGKRPYAARVAEEEVRVAEERLRGTILDLRARVKRAWAELYRIDASRIVLEESRALIEGIEGAARARVANGEGTLAEALRAQTERGRLEAGLAGNTAERTAAAALLNRLAGRDARAPVVPVQVLGRAALPAPPAELVDRVLAEASAVRVMEVMRRAAAFEVEMGRAEKSLDYMLMGRYTNRGSLPAMFEAGVGLKLPLWSGRKQDRAVAELTERELALGHEAEAARLEALAMLREALAAYGRSERLLELYDQGILTQARAAYESALSSYGTGRASFDGVYAAFVDRLRYRLERIGEAAARETAVAQIEALCGGRQ